MNYDSMLTWWKEQKVWCEGNLDKAAKAGDPWGMKLWSEEVKACDEWIVRIPKMKAEDATNNS